MDAKYYLPEENIICNEATVKQSLLRRSYQNKELSSASSISPSMSVSVGENSVVSQFSAFCQANEVDRLVSNQGLITPKERSNQSRRKIRDKSYYKGIVRLKTKEILDEITKLQREITLLSVEERIYIPYKKNAESKAVDLQNLQKTLAEYNILDDMLCRDIELNEAQKELHELETANKKENIRVEKLFAMTEKKETKIKEIEINISQEIGVSEILTTTMNPEICEKLKSLKRMDRRFQITRTEQEKELMNLKKERVILENQCSQNEVLNVGLEGLKKLWSTEETRNEFLSNKNFTSFQDEYEYLQRHENECSFLLKGMSEESQNIECKIRDTMEELKKMESEIYNPCSDRSFTHSKLKKQEEIINDFFSRYHDEHHELLIKQQQHECKIAQLLAEISNKINSFDADLLDEKCKKIIFTNDDPLIIKKMEYVKATEEWEEYSSLESKVFKELDLYKNQIAAFGNKMSIISSTDKLKESFENRKTKLLNELKQVKRKNSVWKHILNNLQNYNNSLQNQLHNDGTYKMLSKLEKQWHLLEKENFAMEKVTASKNFREEYLLLKNNVRKLYLELNNML